MQLISSSASVFIPLGNLIILLTLQCLTLSNKYKRGKLLAYQLLCQMMVRQPDVSIPAELLAQFYQILQQGLCSQDQVTKHCFDACLYKGSKRRAFVFNLNVECSQFLCLHGHLSGLENFSDENRSETMTSSDPCPPPPPPPPKKKVTKTNDFYQFTNFEKKRVLH